MDSTPVIDLTAGGDSPPAAASPPASYSSSSSEDAPLVARSLTARNATSNSNALDTRNANASASTRSNALNVRRLPYPINAASTPIDLTDDDIEYLGEHRLNLPQPHATGSDARPVPGDNYSLMDRLRDVAGMPSTSRNARQAAAQLTTDNLRIINEDPLRHGAAAGGPGPAAVAAANARARRTGGGNAGDNNANVHPPAGFNARRNRRRNDNPYNVNNLRNPPAAPAADPGEYYYRRVAQPPRAARGGRRQAEVYEGLLRNIDHFDPANDFLDDYENANFNEDGDQYDELDYDFGALRRLRGAGNRAGGGARGVGAFQNILEMLGFGGGGGDPLANAAFLNAQPANYNHGNPPKRKVKAYSVRQSHPNFNKKKDGKDGFERDIVPPPEIEEEEQVQKDETAAPLPALSSSKEEAAIDIKTVSATSVNNASVAEDVEDLDKQSKRNKGKGRALEVDNLSVDPTSNAAASDSNTEIPVLDLAHDSPNGSGSTSSSALFSGKISNSTRATSADLLDDADKDKTTLDAIENSNQNAILPPPKPTTRTIRAPVCTSCSTPLYLNQSSTGRPYVLVCGHVICRGCLDIATARFKRWTAEEAEVGTGRNINGDSSSKTAWKGSRLKETFEEVDRSRSSTATGSADVKGKKRAGIRIGAPGSNTAPSSTTSNSAVSTRASRAAGRRTIPVPDYADLDDEQEEGEIDGNYLPRTARDESSSLSPQEGDVHSRTGKAKAEAASDASDENDPPPELSATAGGSKGKGKAKSTKNEHDPNHKEDQFLKQDDSGMLGKRKRTKAHDDNSPGGGKSTSTITKAKTKKQKVEKPSLIDPEWLTCPVRDCKGGTDLGRPIGSREGAWELFV